MSFPFSVIHYLPTQRSIYHHQKPVYFISKASSIILIALSCTKNVYVYISNIAHIAIYLPGNFVVLLQSKTELTGSHNAHSKDTDLAPSSTHLPLMKQNPSCQMYIIMD